MIDALFIVPGNTKGIYQSLPDDYTVYSFHTYNTQSLPTEYLSSEDVLGHRDQSFTDYHTYKPFLRRIESKFGKKVVENINKMTHVKLKRQILGD